MTSDSSHSKAIRTALWILLALALAGSIAARMRLVDLPLERDEGEYAYTGQLMLEGIVPYAIAYSMKFPGTSAAYAVLMSIFGQSIHGIHLGLLVVNLATTALVGLLGQALFGRVAAIAAAASYAVLSLMPHVLGTAAHATHFVVICVIAGCFLLIRASQNESSRWRFACGLVFGLGLLMKQSGFVFIIFGCVYLLARDLSANRKIQTVIRHNLEFIVAAATPTIITCLILWRGGVFARFWFWTINYARAYGSQVLLIDGLRTLPGHLIAASGTAWPIWGLAVFGLISCFTRPTIRARAGFLTTFTIFSALAVCPGFYFRPHYFIQLLPAIALLAAATLAATLEARRNHGNKIAVAAVLVFAGCLAWPILCERDFFFQRPLSEANRMINGDNPFPEAIKLSDYIRDNSSSEDKIAVLGSEPQIYFYSRRHSATGYIYTYSLMEPQPYARQMQEEMMQEIEKARPKFLILVVINKSWLVGRESDQTIFKWADRYCDANYEQVGLINISPEGTEYYLPLEQANVKPTDEHILVYRRKT